MSKEKAILGDEGMKATPDLMGGGNSLITSKFLAIATALSIPLFANAQNVGIGTNTPSAMLHIEVPSGFTSPVLQVNQQGSATPYLIVQPDGKVGIGVASPSEALDVSGNVQFSGALMPGGNAGTAGFVLMSQGAGNAPVWVDTALLGDKWGGQVAQTQGPLVGDGTSANPIGLQSGTSAGDVLIWNGSQWVIKPAPFDSVCNTATANYVMKWTGSELCNSIIYDNGTRVGIGTPTPAVRLHVAGSIAGQSELHLVGPGSGSEGGQINLADPGQTNIGQANAWSIDNYDGDLRIFYNSGPIKMFIDNSTGNVGIGRGNPDYKFDLNGVGDSLFHIGRNNGIGNDFTIDIAGGAGLVNLVAGASLINDGSIRYVYTGVRGASRITLHDAHMIFHIGEQSGTPGNVVPWREAMIIDKYANVGIGLPPGPHAKLLVYSDYNIDTTIYLNILSRVEVTNFDTINRFIRALRGHVIIDSSSGVLNNNIYSLLSMTTLRNGFNGRVNKPVVAGGHGIRVENFGDTIGQLNGTFSWVTFRGGAGYVDSVIGTSTTIALVDSFSGTISKAAAIRVFIADTVPGSIDTAYGIYIGGITGSTERWAIWSVSQAPSRHNGYFGIRANPTNILTVQQGSPTDPIADSWTVYSTRETKAEVIGVVDSEDLSNYLKYFREMPVYKWRRTEGEQVRLSPMADDSNVPGEIRAYDENGNVQGIDLYGYIGFLHVVIKAQQEIIDAQQMQLNQQAGEIEALKQTNNELERRIADIETIIKGMSQK